MKKTYKVTEICTQTIYNVYYVEAESQEEAEEIYDMEGELNDDESYAGAEHVDDIVVEETL